MKEFCSIDDILDFAISNEENAENFYTELAEKMDRQVMKQVFLDFAEEEGRHAEMLKKVKTDQKITLSDAPVADIKIADYLVSSKAEPNMSYQDALILAMKREKAAFSLYQDLARKISDPGLQKLFTKLANEEAKHKMHFEVEYDKHYLAEN